MEGKVYTNKDQTESHLQRTNYEPISLCFLHELLMTILITNIASTHGAPSVNLLFNINRVKFYLIYLVISNNQIHRLSPVWLYQIIKIHRLGQFGYIK